MKRLLGVILLLVVLGTVGIAAPMYTMYVDPFASYFRAAPNDGPGGVGSEYWPWFIDLGALGLLPGQELVISAFGDLCYFSPCQSELPAEYGLVFTSSNAVGVSSLQNRLAVANGGIVPTGAVGAVSPLTYSSGLSTDIAGDFYLMAGQSVTVIIPNGGAYLAIGLWDSYFIDNSDPTPNLAISLNSIPEPSTYLMAFAGLAGLWVLRRKKA